MDIDTIFDDFFSVSTSSDKIQIRLGNYTTDLRLFIREICIENNLSYLNSAFPKSCHSGLMMVMVNRMKSMFHSEFVKYFETYVNFRLQNKSAEVSFNAEVFDMFMFPFDTFQRPFEVSYNIGYIEQTYIHANAFDMVHMEYNRNYKSKGQCTDVFIDEENKYLIFFTFNENKYWGNMIVSTEFLQIYLKLVFKTLCKCVSRVEHFLLDNIRISILQKQNIELLSKLDLVNVHFFNTCEEQSKTIDGVSEHVNKMEQKITEITGKSLVLENKIGYVDSRLTNAINTLSNGFKRSMMKFFTFVCELTSIKKAKRDAKIRGFNTEYEFNIV